MNYISHKQNTFSSSSFTLVELLIVIGILAILTSAIVLILNPAELLRQSRDTTRMSDLASINNAISLALTQDPSLSLGTASTVYVSLIDTTSSCINLGLATLPTGYIYQCPTSATSATQINGSGWLPINFASSSIGSLTKLPIDPTNTTSSGLYFYSYVTNGSQYELVSSFESKKYTDKEASDGGANTTSYEVGNNTTLAPFIGGLVGWWKFDETSGTTAYDSSGYGNHGTMLSSSTPSLLTTQTGCRIGGCINFDGVDDYAAFNNVQVNLSLKANNTVSFWLNISSVGGMPVRWGSLYDVFLNGGYIGFNTYNSETFGYSYDSFLSQWAHIVFVFVNDIPSASNVKIYINGVERNLSYPNSYISSNNRSVTQSVYFSGYDGYRIAGLMDDVRIYNRALSEAEVKALYNNAK